MATFAELPACSLALSSSTSRRRRRDGRHTARRNLRLTSTRLTASSYHLQLHEDNVARPVHGLTSSPSSAGWPARSTTPSPTPRRRRRDCRRTARRHLHGCIYTTTSAGCRRAAWRHLQPHKDNVVTVRMGVTFIYVTMLARGCRRTARRHLHLRDDIAGRSACRPASSSSWTRPPGCSSAPLPLVETRAFVQSHIGL